MSNKRRPVHHRPGERMASRDAGVGTHPARPLAEPEPKEAGRHRWTAAAGYTLTPSQAAAADAGSAVTLGPELLIAFGVGCIDCEGEHHEVRLDPCPAGDEWSR